MNERIEQCLYQAGLTAQGCWDELDDYTKQGIEKFAELIVRECAELADNQEDYLTAKIIKKHFRVE
jgi:TRAP-type C4-dicarboxylate transport system substrate-binding protein